MASRHCLPCPTKHPTVDQGQGRQFNQSCRPNNVCHVGEPRAQLIFNKQGYELSAYKSKNRRHKTEGERVTSSVLNFGVKVQTGASPNDGKPPEARSMGEARSTCTILAHCLVRNVGAHLYAPLHQISKRPSTPSRTYIDKEPGWASTCAETPRLPRSDLRYVSGPGGSMKHTICSTCAEV